MKILITTDWYSPVINGVVTSVLNLKRELEERGHEVRVLTLAIDGHHRKDKNIYYMQSFTIGKVYPNARAAVSVKNTYVKELIEWKPDIIHSQCEFMTFSYAVRIGKKCVCPIVHTYHTVYEEYTHYFSPSKTMGQKMVAVWSRRLLSKVDTVVAPTEKVSKILDNYKIAAPVQVIPTGVDLRKYAHVLSGKKKAEMKKQLGIPSSHKVLVSIGRLAKEKNIDELIDYLFQMKQKEITLLLVGDGPYRKDLEKKVKELSLGEQVMFTGMISPEEVGDYYQLGDVFISASNSETQGLTYIEALASGTPALCKKDSCLEHVVTNGFNGFQFENYSDFLLYLECMLGDETLRRTLCENAKLSAERFSTWTFGSDMERLYRSLVIDTQKAEIGLNRSLKMIFNTLAMRRN